MSVRKPIDCARAKIIRSELTKVRCWVSGFTDGRAEPGKLIPGIPGQDGLRQAIIFLDEILANEKPLRERNGG